jgi:hypothetical protein
LYIRVLYYLWGTDILENVFLLGQSGVLAISFLHGFWNSFISRSCQYALRSTCFWWRIGIRPDPFCMLGNLREPLDKKHLGQCRNN